MVIHPQARATPKLRAEIKAQRDRKQVGLAKQYNVTPQTIRKWQNRDEFTDAAVQSAHWQNLTGHRSIEPALWA